MAVIFFEKITAVRGVEIDVAGLVATRRVGRQEVVQQIAQCDQAVSFFGADLAPRQNLDHRLPPVDILQHNVLAIEEDGGQHKRSIHLRCE